METDRNDKSGGDRRGQDRRQEQVSPLGFADRRTGNRRSGTDRRSRTR